MHMYVLHAFIVVNVNKGPIIRKHSQIDKKLHTRYESARLGYVH